MNAVHRPVRATVLCVSAFGLAPQVSAAEPLLPRDGWGSWQVPAVDAAPDWCCWSSWKARDASRKPCLLASGRDGYGGTTAG